MGNFFIKCNNLIFSKKLNVVSVVLCLAVAANVFSQTNRRSAVGGYEDWDQHHAAYMSASKNLFGAEVAVDAFQTYGPLSVWLGGGVGPHSEHWNYWSMFAWMLVWLSLFYFFIKACQMPHAFLWVGLALCGFNFPNFAYAPWLIVLWCLSEPKGTKSKVCHGLLGIIYVSVLLLFKFSYGFIAFAQIILWSLLKDKSILTNLYQTVLSIFGVMTLTSCLYFLTTEGDILSLYRYVCISFGDAEGYASLMQTPLSFMEGNLVYFWPICLLILVAATALIKTNRPFWWLPLMLLPVSYAEFKHSYTRCDYSNLKGVFFMTGVMTFCLMMRYFHSRILRYCSVAILSLLVLATYTKALPRNVPWRHPRLLWLTTPWADALKWQEKLNESNRNLDEYLSKYSWVKDRVQNETLCVTPAALCLSLLSEKPCILPGAQSYYNILNKEGLDCQALDKRKPTWVLYEHRNIDDRVPGSHHPIFMKKLFSEYAYVEGKEDLYLLKRKAQASSWQESAEESFEIKSGKVDFILNLEKSDPVIYIRAEGLMGWKYQFQKFMLRGERFYLKVNNQKPFMVSLLELSKGVCLFVDMKGFLNKDETRTHVTLSLDGPVNRTHPNDPVHLLPELDLNGTLFVKKLKLK